MQSFNKKYSVLLPILDAHKNTAFYDILNSLFTRYTKEKDRHWIEADSIQTVNTLKSYLVEASVPFYMMYFNGKNGMVVAYEGTGKPVVLDINTKSKPAEQRQFEKICEKLKVSLINTTTH